MMKSVRSWMLVAAAAGWGCNKSAPAASRLPAVPVEVARAALISAPVEIGANGVVEPMQSVSIEAQVGGVLQSVAFKEGDAVTKGQVLFRINPHPFEATLRQAQAALQRDAAQATNAAREAERYRTLVAKDYVTRSQADQAEATAAALRATLTADSSAVEGARIMLGYATIRAPISGRTGSLLVREGNLVKAAGTPLVVINQIQPILVRFPVPQRDFEQLRRRAAKGDVPVTATASDSTVIGDQGKLSFIDNAVDSLTGTVTAKAQFGNGGNQLWPGEYVRLTVRLDVQQNVVAVPTRAIVPGQTSPYLFVVGSDNTVSMHSVAIGRAVGELTVVDSGLVGGEQVVVDGQSKLSPGTRVEIRTTPTRPRVVGDQPIGDTTNRRRGTKK